jgi:uncharacterized membrane protein
MSLFWIIVWVCCTLGLLRLLFAVSPHILGVVLYVILFPALPFILACYFWKKKKRAKAIGCLALGLILYLEAGFLYFISTLPGAPPLI